MMVATGLAFTWFKGDGSKVGEDEVAVVNRQD